MLKEAYAVYYTLKHYGHLLQDSRVMFLQDNKAVECSFEFGSKNSPALTKYIRMIHEEANKWNVAIEVEWVPTHLQEADEASRTIDSKEAILKTADFAMIEKMLGWKFSLDTFAKGNKFFHPRGFRYRNPLGLSPQTDGELCVSTSTTVWD